MIELEAHDVSRFEWLWQLLARERWRARPTILVHMVGGLIGGACAFALQTYLVRW